MGRWGGARRSGADRWTSDPASERALDGGAPGSQARFGIAPEPAPSGFIDRVLVTLSGIRQPIVAILLIMAFFTAISGKPVDGLLLLVVASALAWDAGMSARDAASRAYSRELGYPASGESAQRSAWRLRTGRPRLRQMALGMAAAVIYSLTVGSFTRYSWPATAGVVGLGAGVVVVGWGGPIRHREIPGKSSRSGIITWGLVLVAGGLWELGALLGQPTFEQSSYAHPTISTLTNPLLASSLGRSVALLGWILLGAFLVER